MNIIIKQFLKRRGPPPHPPLPFPNNTPKYLLCLIREQCELKKKLIKEDVVNWFDKDSNNKENIRLNYIGGVDISFVKGDDKHACAALVILSYPELEVWCIISNICKP